MLSSVANRLQRVHHLAVEAGRADHLVLGTRIRRIVDAYARGDREAAVAEYQRWLPLINFENRQCGLLAAKALMKEGGVIGCEAPRHPLPAMHPDTRAGLIETAQRLDPLVLHWGR